MSRFMTIKAEEIAEAFETERRQYFVGNLKRPQHIPFVKSETTEMGLTAYDTQMLKHHYAYFGGDAAMLHKASIIGALNLYLDFINLFLMLLRLMGDRR